jgi:hypothetical protein
MKARVGDRLVVRRHHRETPRAPRRSWRSAGRTAPRLPRALVGRSESILVPGSETAVEPPPAGDVQEACLARSGGRPASGRFEGWTYVEREIDIRVAREPRA